MTDAPSPSAAPPAAPLIVTEPLPRAWPWYSQQARERVSRRIEAGDVYAFGRHDAITDLEGWATEYFGVRHALAVSSGTAALASAFFSLDLQAGDEVLVPTYTFHATCTPLFQTGVRPVLYDCDPVTARADIGDLESRVTSRTRAVVVTHMFGLPADMDEVMRIARQKGLAVVEDAAQAHGATYKGRRVGTIGDVGCFSLGGQKTISGGMGGLVVTDRTDVYEKSLCFGHAHERAQEEILRDSSAWAATAMGFGSNLRMHPLAAELALDHCSSLGERIKIRTEILTGLTDSLRQFDFLSLPETPADCTRGGWYGYKVRYRPERLGGLPIGRFVSMLKERGVAVSVPTTRPLHHLWPFGDDGSAQVGDPTAHRVRQAVGPTPELSGATGLYEATISFPDKHLHEPAERLIAQYIDAIGDAAEADHRKGGDTHGEC